MHRVAVTAPFFDVRGVLMHPDGRGVDHLKVAAISLRHRLENRVPNPDFPPADEPVVTGRGGAITLRDISPRRASSKTPIDAVEHLAVIRARDASWLVRQQRRDDRPLEIRQFVPASVHRKSSPDFEPQLARQRNPLYEFVT